jgi:hypothetical protein
MRAFLSAEADFSSSAILWSACFRISYVEFACRNAARPESAECLFQRTIIATAANAAATADPTIAASRPSSSSAFFFLRARQSARSGTHRFPAARTADSDSSGTKSTGNSNAGRTVSLNSSGKQATPRMGWTPAMEIPDFISAASALVKSVNTESSTSDRLPQLAEGRMSPLKYNCFPSSSKDRLKECEFPRATSTGPGLATVPASRNATGRMASSLRPYPATSSLLAPQTWMTVCFPDV